MATEKSATMNEEARQALVNELVSAVGEAFNNAVLHAYCGVVPDDVSLLATFDGERIVVEITDWGASFVPEQIAAPDLDSLPVSGMGLHIVRSFVDRFEYLPGPPNVLRLTKLLDGQ